MNEPGGPSSENPVSAPMDRPKYVLKILVYEGEGLDGQCQMSMDRDQSRADSEISSSDISRALALGLGMFAQSLKVRAGADSGAVILSVAHDALRSIACTTDLSLGEHGPDGGYKQDDLLGPPGTTESGNGQPPRDP